VIRCRHRVEGCQGDFLSNVARYLGDAERRREAGYKFRMGQICRACADYHRAIYVVSQPTRRSDPPPRRGRAR